MTERGKMKKTVREAEAERVAGILKRDADDAERERRREIAVAQVASGEFANLDDTVVPPTAEMLEKGAFTPYTPRGLDDTVRSVRTVRRVITDTLLVLHQRGVIDDDLFAACRWYRDRYEAAQLQAHVGVASYGESVRGDPAFGHLPRTAWAAEARSDFRYAQSFIREDVLGIFENVCLHSQSLKEAARTGRCRFKNAAAAFLQGALDLHGGIAHRLKIEPGKPE